MTETRDDLVALNAAAAAAALDSVGSSLEDEEEEREPLLGDQDTSVSATTTTEVEVEEVSSNLPLIKDDDELKILCELVGACDLQQEEDGLNYRFNDEELEPYCLVKFAGNTIHRTKKAEEKGPNPIWAASTQSLFLIQTTPKELSRNCLEISIWTKRRLASLAPHALQNKSAVFLGQVRLDAMTIISHCDEERFEKDLEDQLGESGCGSLALRFRLASTSDTQFMHYLHRSSKCSPQSVGSSEMCRVLYECNAKPVAYEPSPCLRKLAEITTEKDETSVAGATILNAISSAFMSKTSRDRDTGQARVRVKPGPDPTRASSTTYMTPYEMAVETMRPSQHWVEAGTGSLGKLHVEILSCHDLPNMDVGEAVGNVTDSFVCAVFEDAMAQTPVIDDELSPHWMPWTNRAFCFGIMHPASILYLGVFDYDLGLGGHSPIGRVAINISNLQRDTVFTLKYNLYPSSNITARDASGVITVRLRIEYADEKQALLTALKPRPAIHVNVRKEKTFRVVRYTCFGEFDNEEKFDLTVTRSYLNEIFQYKSALGYAIGDAMKSLVFWRGQVHVFGLLLPVHSFFFFCAGCILVERPYLAPSFMLLSVAWIMLATLTHRRQHPSPWNRCPSFRHYLDILHKGHSSLAFKHIAPREGWAEAQAYEKAWENRLEQDQKVAATRAALQEQISTIGDDKIQTKVAAGVIPLDLLDRLGRYQAMIGRYCLKFRFIKIILTWEESIVSFWITAVFLSAGIVSLLLPWAWILTWLGRLVVWLCLGPHMKLVDVFLQAQASDDLQKVVQTFKKQHLAARLRREQAVKLKDIKCQCFGEYITLVPAFNLARHHDRPLPESFAKTFRRGSMGPIFTTVSYWIPGQQLSGAMIPRPAGDSEKVDPERVVQLQEFLEEYKTRGLERRRSNAESEEIPCAIGYELVPKMEPYLHTNWPDSMMYQKDDDSNVLMVQGCSSDPNFLADEISITPSVLIRQCTEAAVEESVEVVAYDQLYVIEDSSDVAEDSEDLIENSLDAVEDMLDEMEESDILGKMEDSDAVEETEERGIVDETEDSETANETEKGMDTTTECETDDNLGVAEDRSNCYFSDGVPQHVIVEDSHRVSH